MRHRLRCAVLIIAAAAGCATQARAQFTLDRTPLLDIGATAANGDINFEAATRVARFPDGTVAVTDGSALRVHFFDGAGRKTRSAGSAGPGPNEWQSVMWAARCASDTLFVFDVRGRRMTAVTRTGDIARQFAFPPSGGMPDLLQLGCSHTGAIVYMRSAPGARGGTPPIFELPGAIALSTTAGAAPRELALLSMGEVASWGRGGGPRPLGRFAVVAAGGGLVYAGAGDTSGVAVFAADGSRRGTIATNWPARPATDAHLTAAVERIVALVPNQSRTMARDGLLGAPRARNLPPYSAITVDPDGLAWLTVSAAGEPITVLRAFGPDGRQRGEVTIPRDLTVHEVGRDYVLGVYEDADDLPHVAVYRLRRGA